MGTSEILGSSMTQLLTHLPADVNPAVALLVMLSLCLVMAMTQIYAHIAHRGELD